VIDSLATKHSLLTGKWVLHIPKEHINAIWRKLAVCVGNPPSDPDVLGELIFSTKVGTAMSYGTPPHFYDQFIICLYVLDYTQTKKVMAVGKAINNVVEKYCVENGVEKVWELKFKPDIYTYLGIYQFNGQTEWRYEHVV